METRPTLFVQNRVQLKNIRLALSLARRGLGQTSPNPMVGAVLVRSGKIIGRGWHRRAGLPHAEIEALRDAHKHGFSAKGATLYVTLEPCCTHGRTPPCTDAIMGAGIKSVIVGAIDPNPKHSGRAFKILRRAGIEVVQGVLTDECARLNEAFNHWIVHRTPFVIVKTAMTLDGKIATATGESKWITGEAARACGMKLRHGTDAILVGINTILADDPGLTARMKREEGRGKRAKPIRRIILDSQARTPLDAKIVSDQYASLTTIVVGKRAPKNRVVALAKRVNVIIAPVQKVGRGKRHEPARGRRRGSERVVFARWFGAARVVFLRAENPGRARFAQGCRGRGRQESGGGDSASRR